MTGTNLTISNLIPPASRPFPLSSPYHLLSLCLRVSHSRGSLLPLITSDRREARVQGNGTRDHGGREDEW